MNRKHTGFSLIELMIVLVVAAIVLTLAVPSMRDLILNNRITTQTNEFVSSLTLARSEAIKRGVDVDVDSTSAGTDWENGWIVSVGGATLRTYAALDGDITLTGSVNQIDFDSRGSRDGTVDFTFDVCDDRTAETGIRITLSRTGRPNVADRVCP